VRHACRLHQLLDADAVDAAQPESRTGRVDDLLVVEPLLLLRDAGHVDHLPGELVSSDETHHQNESTRRSPGLTVNDDVYNHKL
jgi:hypothetical protein